MIKKESKTDPSSSIFDVRAHELRYGDLREKLGYPRVFPADFEFDWVAEDYKYSQEAKEASQDKEYMKRGNRGVE
uniref:Uncharacterized protein n=1 Tax=viral metagenome TaxID=1070528 RepID=A0A6M3IG01_9ZZZZ